MENQEEILHMIKHYQRNLERYIEKNNKEKMIYCINKLSKIPITVALLEKTGVGKTVNGIRRLGGEVAQVAKVVVSHWKEVVENESRAQEEAEEEEEEEEEEEDEESSENEEECESEAEESPEEKEERYSHKAHTSSKTEHRHSQKHEIEHSKHNTHEKSHRHSDKVSKSSSKSSESKRHEKKHESSSKSSKTSHSHSHSESSKHKSEKQHSSKDEHDDKKSSKEKDKKSSKKRSHDDEENNTVSNKKIKLNKHTSKQGTNDGIGCESGKSFAEALGMLEPSSSNSNYSGSSRTKTKDRESVSHSVSSSKEKKSQSHHKSKKSDASSSNTKSSNKKVDVGSRKSPPLLNNLKLEPLDINLSSLLPEITPNYRPLGIVCDIPKRNKILDDEALSAGITSKTQRTKVYSGNKSYYGKVTTLFDLCIRVLQENIDALEFTGGVPYSILKPVLDRCTADQLHMMEHHNPYLIEDTDELWKFHCQKQFRNKKREEMETWRDMYMRCSDEREAKLKTLTSNIKQSQEKSTPVRQTMLAYVDSIAKPPRNVARKQAKNGIDNKSVAMVTPSIRLNALATSGEAGKICVPNPGQKAVNSGSSGYNAAALKPRKAPLMQKALALIKNRYRR